MKKELFVCFTISFIDLINLGAQIQCALTVYCFNSGLNQPLEPEDKSRRLPEQ